jgi:hypothetical protein
MVGSSRKALCDQEGKQDSSFSEEKEAKKLLFIAPGST